VQSSEYRENNYDRHAKKKQKVLDDVDIFLANEKSTHNTTICTNCKPSPKSLLRLFGDSFTFVGKVIGWFGP
jgi:hypothetical protein